MALMIHWLYHLRWCYDWAFSFLPFVFYLLSVHVVYCTRFGTVRYSLFYFFIFNIFICSKFKIPRTQTTIFNVHVHNMSLLHSSQKCTNNNERNSWWWCSMIKNVLVHNNNFKLHVLLRTLTNIYNQFLTDFHLCNLQLWTRDKHGQHPHNPRDKNCRLHDDDDCNNHTGTMILWLIQLVIRKTLEEQSVASCQTS